MFVILSLQYTITSNLNPMLILWAHFYNFLQSSKFLNERFVQTETDTISGVSQIHSISRYHQNHKNWTTCFICEGDIHKRPDGQGATQQVWCQCRDLWDPDICPKIALAGHSGTVVEVLFQWPLPSFCVSGLSWSRQILHQYENIWSVWTPLHLSRPS